MSTMTAAKSEEQRSSTVASKIRVFNRPWRQRGSSDMFKPPLPIMLVQYILLILLFLLAVGPFLWQLSTSLKGPTDDIYTQLIPMSPSLKAYGEVAKTIPILHYAGHSLMVAIATVISNVVLSTMGGYAIGVMKFRGKSIAVAILLSTMLLPGEVTLTAQYLTIKSLGVADSLVGVFLPGAVAAMNVLLMATACLMIPPSILDAAVMDGASALQRLRHIVWPNVRSMASVVALFSFIGAWNDFLWPLVVLTDNTKYTLELGMQYLQAGFFSNPRVVAAGTIISLVPIIILFGCCQRFFFQGVQEGGVKG